jgi:hypothetical protein
VTGTTAVTIVTGADHRFRRTLCQFLLSARRRHLDDECEFVAYDLGLSPSDRRQLERSFPWCGLRAFPFDRCPPHVRDLRNFAWKPIAIADALERSRGVVLWFDSATILSSLAPIVDLVARDGLFSLTGQTPIGECTDPRTLALLAVPPADRRRPYRAGGALGVDGAREDIRSLVDEWRAHALDPECIAPSGADRRVHRYDQAILSALLYRRERTHGLALTAYEIDISSWKPVSWISTRNKVPTWFPMALDPVVRAWYTTYKALDRFVLEAKERGLARTIVRRARRRPAA